MVSALLSNPKTSEPNGSRRVSLPGTSKGQPLAAFRTRCRRQAPTHGDWNRKTWGAARAAISWLRARSGPDAKLAGKSCSSADPSSDRGRNSAQRGKGSWPRSHREKQVFQRPVEMPLLPRFLPSFLLSFSSRPCLSPSLPSFPPSFMHFFNKHLLSACYVPGSVLGTETATPTAGAKPLVGKISINQIITHGNVRLQPEREGAHERLHRGARRGTLSSFVKWGLLACPPPSPPGRHAGS